MLCTVLILVLVIVCLLLCLGFRFSSKAAVHERYRDMTAIHSHEYDFYLDNVPDENGVMRYATSHVTVKKYGFLYKRLEEQPSKMLVSENGDYVGSISSYETDGKIYNFIHWMISADTDSDGNSYTSMKYYTETIEIYGEEIPLFLHCHAVTDTKPETFKINENRIFAITGTEIGSYWQDENVLVINDISDVDSKKIKDFYDSMGIIVIRSYDVADDVEAIIKSGVTSNYTPEDLAVIFYKTDKGSTGSGCIQGNTTELDREIDDMISRVRRYE